MGPHIGIVGPLAHGVFDYSLISHGTKEQGKVSRWTWLGSSPYCSIVVKLKRNPASPF
jgi:hypothetical protein